MGLTDRSSEAIGGPRGGTAWFDCGDSFSLATIAGSTTPSTVITTTQPGLIVCQTVTRPNPFYLSSLSSSQTYGDVLDATNVIQTLYGFQVTAAVVMASSIHLTLTMSVYRVVGLTSGAGASGTTSITLKAPLTQAIPDESTLTITKVDGSASTTTTIGPDVGVAAGATTIPVDSVNLTGYADSSFIVWQVGNAYAFGWAAGAGAGTPAFPVGASIIAPANTTPATGNSSLVAGTAAWPGPGGTTTALAAGLPVQAGDALVLNIVTDSATVTAQPMNIQPLLT
jgi:hypothetical protein